MSSIDFVHTVDIQVGRARLYDFLCDLQNYRPLHPLIESIEEIAPSEEMPRARRYRVVDRIPVGPFRIRTVYTAVLEPVTENEIHGHAWQVPGIRIHTVYELEEVALGMRLSERVSIKAPRLLHRFVVREARRSHRETLTKMKDHLSASVC
jgi:hypothetical protein